MDAAKVREVTQRYRDSLAAQPLDFPNYLKDPGYTHARQHIRGMVDKIDKFLDEGRTEKAMRWLGFVQGVMWVMGIHTIEELANHNRPTTTGE